MGSFDNLKADAQWEIPKVTGFIQVKNKFLLEDYAEFYITVNEEAQPYDPNHKFTLYRGVSHEYKDIVYVFETRFYIRAKDVIDFTVFNEYNNKIFELVSTIDDDSPKYRYINDYVIKENYAKLIEAERNARIEHKEDYPISPIKFGNKTVPSIEDIENKSVKDKSGMRMRKIKGSEIRVNDLIAVYGKAVDDMALQGVAGATGFVKNISDVHPSVVNDYSENTKVIELDTGQYVLSDDLLNEFWLLGSAQPKSSENTAKFCGND